MKISKIVVAALFAASFFSISCKEKTAEAQTAGSASVSKAAKNAKPNPESDFYYDFNKDLTAARIRNYKGKSDKIVVPETIQGLPVVMVTLDSKIIKKASLIVIPSSVKFAEIRYIGEENKKPSELILSDGLEYLTLQGNIKSLNLPSTLKYFWLGYSNPIIDSLVLPDSIRYVELYYARVKTLTFPAKPASGKIYIGKLEFNDDYNIEQINLPDNPAEALRYWGQFDAYWAYSAPNKINFRKIIKSKTVDNSVELQKKFNFDIFGPSTKEYDEFIEEVHGDDPLFIVSSRNFASFYGFKKD